MEGKDKKELQGYKRNGKGKRGAQGTHLT